jgi:hypothetical protein
MWKNEFFYENPLEESRDTEARLSLLRFFSIDIAGSDDDRCPIRPYSASFDCNHPQNWQELSCSTHRLSSSEGLHSPIHEFRMKSNLLSSSIDTQRHVRVEENCHLWRRTHKKMRHSQTNPETSTSSVPSRKIAQSQWDPRTSRSDRECYETATPSHLQCLHKYPGFTTENCAYVENLNVIDDTRSIRYAQSKEAKDISIFDTPVGLRASNLDRNKFDSRIWNYSAADIVGFDNPSTLNKSSGTFKESLLLVHPIDPLLVTIPKQQSRQDSTSNALFSEVPHKRETRHYLFQEHDKQLFDTMPSTSGRMGGPTVENGEAVQFDNAYNRSNGRVPVRTQTSSSSDVHRTAPLRTGTSSIIDDDPNSTQNEVSASQPTPLFERLVTEEVQELRAYVRIVENQNRRLLELERVHGDLEARLEIESKSRQQLEATLEAREREWAEKLEHVKSDRDQWKLLVEAEKIKNSKLIDQVVRKDQDIHRMLQRKVCLVAVFLSQVCLSTH